MALLKTTELKFGNFHCKMLALSPKAEHVCVIAYAAAETLGLHGLMYWISIGIAATGGGSVAHDFVKKGITKHKEKKNVHVSE